jgi:hypothetical protein
VVLYAIDPAEVFSPNINVVAQSGFDELPSVEDLEANLQTIVPDPNVSESRLAGSDALKATYELDLAGTTVQGIHYLVLGENGLLGFTFTASADDPQTKIFKKMIKSIELD